MKRLRKRAQELLLTAPSFVWLSLFFLIPTALVFILAFRPADPFGGIGKGWTTATIKGLADPQYLVDRPADALGQLPLDGDLHAPGRPDGVRRRPGLRAPPEHAPSARHRPVLDKLPHPGLCLEVDPSSRGIH